MTRKRLMSIAACLLTAAASAFAQAGTVEQSRSATPAVADAAAAPPPPQGYSYDPAGRRDPFVSLVRRGTESRPSATGRPNGVPGLLIGELTIKGIVKDRSGFIAMVQGPDNKQTYIIRTGERLMDGSVKVITADAVVFSQDVNDPLSMVKQKEIRKTIRPADEAGRS